MATTQAAALNPYVNMLIGPQRRALMELLARVSEVDGDVSLEEVAFIAEASARLGVEVPVGELFEAARGRDLAVTCACFDRPDTRAVALAELIGIAFADGHYDASERRAVREIAEAMGAEETLVDRVEAWVEDGLLWQAAGQRLFGFGPGGPGPDTASSA